VWSDRKTYKAHKDNNLINLWANFFFVCSIKIDRLNLIFLYAKGTHRFNQIFCEYFCARQKNYMAYRNNSVSSSEWTVLLRPPHLLLLHGCHLGHPLSCYLWKLLASSLQKNIYVPIYCCYFHPCGHHLPNVLGLVAEKIVLHTIIIL
jgi:hypothetical protein